LVPKSWERNTICGIAPRYVRTIVPEFHPQNEKIRHSVLFWPQIARETQIGLHLDSTKTRVTESSVVWNQQRDGKMAGIAGGLAAGIGVTAVFGGSVAAGSAVEGVVGYILRENGQQTNRTWEDRIGNALLKNATRGFEGAVVGGLAGT
jgi:hypothetical protein